MPQKISRESCGKHKGFPLERGCYSVDLSILSKDHPQERQPGLCTSRTLTRMWLTDWPVYGKSLCSTWVSREPEGGSRWQREATASLGCYTTRRGPALCPALLCMGRRGKQAWLMSLLMRVRQHPPLPAIATAGVKGNIQSKQKTIPSATTRGSDA